MQYCFIWFGFGLSTKSFLLFDFFFFSKPLFETFYMDSSMFYFILQHKSNDHDGIPNTLCSKLRDVSMMFFLNRKIEKYLFVHEVFDFVC